MYLIKADYKKQIQDVNLNQIISSDESILNSAQLAAEAECISYLAQKFDTDKEFTSTTEWNKSLIYKAENRVYIVANAYDATVAYTLGTYVNQSGNVYKNTTAIVTPESFNPNKWQLIAPQNTLYYASYPKPKFNIKKYYEVGDEVWWNDKVYVCRKATSSIPHEVLLQLGTYNNAPQLNVFPDDAKNGIQFWGTGTAYSIAANTDITDTTKWTKGDNRSQQMVTYLIDITLYLVHSRLTPRNVPQMRIDRYLHAVEWLQMAGQGKITAALPLLQPTQGNRIRFNSNIKNINSY